MGELVVGEWVNRQPGFTQEYGGRREKGLVKRNEMRVTGDGTRIC